MTAYTLPVLGFCAWGSGAGKTTLLTGLIPALRERGMRVSVIKHAHHRFDIDYPGKDSYRLRQAGAMQTLIGSRHRWALITETSGTAGLDAPELGALLAQLDPTLADLVLLEGFRQETVPKIEVYRPALGYPLLAHEDPNIIAVATDQPITTPLPRLDLNDVDAIADFVQAWARTQAALSTTTHAHVL